MPQQQLIYITFLIMQFKQREMDSDEDDRYMANNHANNRQKYSDDQQERNESSQESNESQSQQNSMRQIQESDKQKIERQILEKAIQKEKKIPYEDEITSQIFQKINKLKHAAKKQNGEELVNLKIQELAYNKLLVLNYNKADFRLVMAHFNLGEAYLKFQCIEQAIEHIHVALHKNQKLFQEIPKTRMLQIHMYTTLAQAFMANNSFDDAIEALNNSESVQEKYNAILSQYHRAEKKDLIKNLKPLILKAQCLCKQRKFQDALYTIDEVIQETDSQQRKIERAFAFVDKANIYAEMKIHEKFLKAIEYQEEAIKILVNANYSKPEQVAQLYENLSVFYQNIGNPQNSLTCIQKVKTLYEELHSPEDKKVIKVRRKIATALLKSQRYKEAVAQLLQISKLQQKIFGESIQLARTLKLLGTVYISLEIGDARVYLKRSLNIFHNLGNKKQASEVRQKLKALNDINGNIQVNIMSQQDI